MLRPMRTHQKIVQDHGASSLFRDLSERGVKLNQTTPQRWADRDSIPSEYWSDVVALGLASLDELANAAALRRGRAA